MTNLSIKRFIEKEDILEIIDDAINFLSLEIDLDINKEPIFYLETTNSEEESCIHFGEENKYSIIVYPKFTRGDNKNYLYNSVLRKYFNENLDICFQQIFSTYLDHFHNLYKEKYFSKSISYYSYGESFIHIILTNLVNPDKHAYIIIKKENKNDNKYGISKK